jgi:hypothetical protein
MFCKTVCFGDKIKNLLKLAKLEALSTFQKSQWASKSGPMGEKSPNLVTLVRNVSGKKVFF